MCHGHGKSTVYMGYGMAIVTPPLLGFLFRPCAWSRAAWVRESSLTCAHHPVFVTRRNTGHVLQVVPAALLQAVPRRCAAVVEVLSVAENRAYPPARQWMSPSVAAWQAVSGSPCQWPIAALMTASSNNSSTLNYQNQIKIFRQMTPRSIRIAHQWWYDPKHGHIIQLLSMAHTDAIVSTNLVYLWKHTIW